MKSKKIIDIATIVLLIAAFGLAYYTGLVGRKADGQPMLELKTFALIAICGTLVLMFVGGVSELLARVKNNAVTVSFTAFMALQVVSFIGMCAISIALLSGAFETTSGWIRGLFVFFAAVQLLGYVQAVIYTGGTEEQAALTAAEEAGEEAGSDDQAEEYGCCGDDDEAETADED